MCVAFAKYTALPPSDAEIHRGSATGKAAAGTASCTARVTLSICMTPRSVTKITASPPRTLVSSLGNGVGDGPE
jgi:hypothetical protein